MMIHRNSLIFFLFLILQTIFLTIIGDGENLSFLSKRIFLNELLSQPVQSVESFHDLSLKEEYLTPQRKLQGSSSGWFVTNIYQDSSCRNVAMSQAVATNQCLYSSSKQISFTISCISGTAFMNIYNDSNCQEPKESAQYPLNTCSPQSIGNSEQYSCTSSISTLQLPLGYSYVLYEFFGNSICQSNMVQYIAYIGEICYEQYPNKSMILRSPIKITYNGSNCEGPGVTSQIQFNRCMDWTKSNSYGYVDYLDPYSSYLLLASITTSTLRPSMIPTPFPTFRPTTTSAPSISFAPTSVSPTVSPTTLPTVSPTAFRRTSMPTRLPNYLLLISITQTFQNLLADEYIIAQSSALQLASTLASSYSSIASIGNYFAIVMLTVDSMYAPPVDNTSTTSSITLSLVANISYTLQVTNTRAFGFTSADQAYANISKTIIKSIRNGNFNSNWKSTCQQFDLDDYEGATTNQIYFLSYSSQMIIDSPSVMPTIAPEDSNTSISLTTIITIVFTAILGCCCLPLIAFVIGYISRKLWKFKIAFSPVNDSPTVELAEAQYIPDDTEFTAVGITTNLNRVVPLPEAKLVQPPIVVRGIEI